jgi:branched-chain amino acid transport system permease protein
MEMIGLSEPLLIGIAISAIAALSFYVAFAAGQFNVAQAGFMSVGAYSVAMTTTSGRSATLGVIIGLLVSVALGAAVSAITRKLSGVYLAIATLAFVQVIEQVIYITPALNGPMGIYGIPLSLDAMQNWLILALVSFLVYRMMKSRIGYEMHVLREDPIVARGIGVNEIWLRIFSGIASAALASIAGSMKALTTSYISPDEFSFGLLIQILSFAVVGGTDRFWGPMIGAAVLTLLPEYTRVLQDYRTVFTGVILLGVILLFPEGLAGGLIRLKEYLRLRIGRRAGMAGSLAGDRRAAGLVARSDDPPSAPVCICEASDLERHFGGVAAVDGVSLELWSSTVQGLIGPNGAGKSTLVDLISGEQRPGRGIVRFVGVDVTKLPAYQRARLGIVRTFQHSRVTQNITAHEVVYSGCLMATRPSSLGLIFSYPATRRSYRAAAERADAILGRLDLAAAATRYVRDLGWEEQRRLEIARALALDPKVLLLDEPTAGMHASSLPGFSRLVRELASTGTAVVLIEHNVAFMRATVDKLYAMDSGRKIASGTPDEVLRTPSVVDSYLGTRSA